MFEWIKSKTTLKRKSFSDYDDYRVECKLEFMRDVINEQNENIKIILILSFIVLINILIFVARDLMMIFALPIFLFAVSGILINKYKFLYNVLNEYDFLINGIEVKELGESIIITDDAKKSKRKTKK